MDYYEDNKAFFERMLKENYAYILTHAYKICNGKVMDGKDLAQDVFLKAWENIDKFDKSSKINPYLISIMRNLYIDSLRIKKRRGGYKQDIDTLPNTSLFSNNDLGVEKFEAQMEQDYILNSLTEDQRKVMELRCKEYRNKDIAEYLDCSEGRVANLILRARQRLNRQKRM